MTKLLVANCSREAAKYAVEKWHYSFCLPSGKLITIGAWENESFIGSIIFGRGATPFLLSPYGLDQTQGCELVRIALDKHETPVSSIMSKAIKILKTKNPGLRIIVSFADPYQNHLGTIYQANNWIYAGKSESAHFLQNKKTKKIVHPRTIAAAKKNGKKINKEEDYITILMPGKHRYLYPLDRAMKKQIEKFSKPYPRAVEGSEVSRDASGVEGQVRFLPTALKV